MKGDGADGQMGVKGPELCEIRNHSQQRGSVSSPGVQSYPIQGLRHGGICLGNEEWSLGCSSKEKIKLEGWGVHYSTSGPRAGAGPPPNRLRPEVAPPLSRVEAGQGLRGGPASGPKAGGRVQQGAWLLP